MRHVLSRFAAVLILVWFVSSPAIAQKFELTGKPYRVKWSPPGSWNGNHIFPGVYCVDFPSPATAIDLEIAFFSNNAIFLSSVAYPESLLATIAVSTIPAGRSVDFEMARLLEVERGLERAYGVSYNITEFTTEFGPTIGLTIKNLVDRSPNGPFPLVRSIFKSPDLMSLAVHRLFVRGAARFEVAIIQAAKQPAAENAEQEMTTRLTTVADDIVRSLQKCTAAFPVRTPK